MNKVGDKVRVKSLEWYNKNKDEYGEIIMDTHIFTTFMAKHCGSIVTIDFVCLDSYNIKEDDGLNGWTDDMFEGLVERELNEPQDNEQTLNAVDDVDCVKPVVFENIVFPNENYADKVELCLGNAYEIVVEDGRTFVQKKKPKYPPTYVECCKILNIPDNVHTIIGYKSCELEIFQRILICRDAYWKIAGEQMGLGKSWEPDWNESKPKDTIVVIENELVKRYALTQNYILAFPTEEMRDDFYENFKGLIENCKELL